MPNPILLRLMRINRRRLHNLHAALGPYGYSDAMHLILSHVCRLPGISQEQIACFFSLDKTSVARDARKLEQLGHIRREIVPEDRRRYALYPTAQGIAMYEMLCSCYDTLAETMTAGFSLEERELLEQLLLRLEQNLSPESTAD